MIRRQHQAYTLGLALFLGLHNRRSLTLNREDALFQVGSSSDRLRVTGTLEKSVPGTLEVRRCSPPQPTPFGGVITCGKRTVE